jgi:hypothetical protein
MTEKKFVPATCDPDEVIIKYESVEHEELCDLLRAKESYWKRQHAERRETFEKWAGLENATDPSMTGYANAIDWAESLVGLEFILATMGRYGLLQWIIARNNSSHVELLSKIADFRERTLDSIMRNQWRGKSTSQFSNAVEVAQGEAMLEMYQWTTEVVEIISRKES